MFSVVGETPWEELQEQIRQVPLLLPRGGELVYPYENARINLYEIPYAAVRPTSLYVVSRNLQLQRELAADLESQGVDPLALEGMVHIKQDDQPPVGLMPPIVEHTPAEGMYVLDGLHRSYIGKQAGRLMFRGIHISGIRHDCPAAVYPNEWSDVIEYTDVPTDPMLKRHYRDHQEQSRRNFAALNGSRPRTS